MSLVTQTPSVCIFFSSIRSGNCGTHWTCCTFFLWTSDIQCTTWYVYVYMKTCCWTCVCCIHIWLLTGHYYTCTFITKTQYTIPVCQRMMCRRAGTYFCHGCACFCVVYMTTMRSYIIIILFRNMTFYFTRIVFFNVVTSVFALFQMTILPC